jgi:hypothetical protein
LLEDTLVDELYAAMVIAIIKGEQFWQPYLDGVWQVSTRIALKHTMIGYVHVIAIKFRGIKKWLRNP